MKLVVSAFLVSAVAGFSSQTSTKLGTQLGAKSSALPWEECPKYLDGSLVGDAGFDPVGFASVGKAPTFAAAADPDLASIDALTWYREAELIHGRIAMMAVVGFFWPGLFGTFFDMKQADINDSSANIFATILLGVHLGFVEQSRIENLRNRGKGYIPGDYNLGQGEGRYNPFGFNYTPEEYKEKQLQELKNGRLAMLAAGGLFHQAQNSGMSIVDQLSSALSSPEYYAKAGYFLPEGI